VETQHSTCELFYWGERGKVTARTGEFKTLKMPKQDRKLIALQKAFPSDRWNFKER
jgi:hypothetical protein